jgi:hypothetical protein
MLKLLKSQPNQGWHATGDLLFCHNIIKRFIMTNTNSHIKVIHSRTHAVIDYLMGAVWMALPWLLNFANNDAATWVPVIAGGFTIFYSLITDYKASLFDIISMKAHLVIDRVVGFFVMVSPWIFEFANQVWQPHLLTGFIVIVVSFITVPRRNAWARLRRLLHRKALRLGSSAMR